MPGRLFHAILGARKPGIEPFVREVAAATRRVAPAYGLPPLPTDAFVTAHAILSSGWFDGDLPRLHRNIFGVKAGRSWTGPVALLPTGECYTDEEIARAQSIPSGQRGSFLRFSSPAGHTCPPGHRHVKIIDAFRKYPTIDAAVRDHLDLVVKMPRYARAAVALRRGDLDYMRLLGEGGWYTADPVETSDNWKSVLRTLLAGRRGEVAILLPDRNVVPSKPGTNGMAVKQAGVLPGGATIWIGGAVAAGVAWLYAQRETS